METIQNIFVDSLNGFPVHHIPLFLFQLLCAGLGGQILQIILNKKGDEKLLEYSALTAVGIAVLSGIVKYSVSFSVLGAAVILLLFNRGKDKGKLENIGQVLVVVIGVGCGVGSVVQTVLGCIIIFAIILFTPLKK